MAFFSLMSRTYIIMAIILFIFWNGNSHEWNSRNLSVLSKSAWRARLGASCPQTAGVDYYVCSLWKIQNKIENKLQLRQQQHRAYHVGLSQLAFSFSLQIYFNDNEFLEERGGGSYEVLSKPSSATYQSVIRLHSYCTSFWLITLYETKMKILTVIFSLQMVTFCKFFLNY